MSVWAAALPEFLGSLAASLLLAAGAWAARKLGGRRETAPSPPRAEKSPDDSQR